MPETDKMSRAISCPHPALYFVFQLLLIRQVSLHPTAPCGLDDPTFYSVRWCASPNTRLLTVL